VILDLPLMIRGETEDKRPFQEETFTLTVSAHGGLVFLENRVALGQKVLLLNPKTRDERECTVAFLVLPTLASPPSASSSLNPRLNFGPLPHLPRIGISPRASEVVPELGLID
jgi:hypothetical protein